MRRSVFSATGRPFGEAGAESDYAKQATRAIPSIISADAGGRKISSRLCRLAGPVFVLGASQHENGEPT
jgi:hypothetical protein